MNVTPEDKTAIAQSLREMAKRIESGEISVLDIKSSRGVAERPTRYGFYVEKYPTREMWLDIHYEEKP